MMEIFMLIVYVASVLILVWFIYWFIVGIKMGLKVNKIKNLKENGYEVVGKCTYCEAPVYGIMEFSYKPDVKTCNCVKLGNYVKKIM